MAPVGEEPVLKALVFFTWCWLWRQSVDEDPPGGASGCRPILKALVVTWCLL